MAGALVPLQVEDVARPYACIASGADSEATCRFLAQAAIRLRQTFALAVRQSARESRGDRCGQSRILGDSLL